MTLNGYSNSDTSSENSEEFLEEGEEEIEQDQTLYSALTDLLNEIPPTREELIEAQIKDEFCPGIRNYLLSKDNEKKKLNKPPNWMEKIGGYMLDSKVSTNKDGLLVYFNPTFDEELNDSGNGFKAVIPRSLIRRVMFACHGHPLSEHAGISKTIHRTKQIYYWPKMSRHIRVYVRRCQHCQQTSKSKLSEKNNIQKDIIIIPSQPEIQVEQTNSSNPDVKTQGRHHKKHLKREAKRNGTYVPPVKPPDRKPRTYSEKPYGSPVIKIDQSGTRTLSLRLRVGKFSELGPGHTTDNYSRISIREVREYPLKRKFDHASRVEYCPSFNRNSFRRNEQITTLYSAVQINRYEMGRHHGKSRHVLKHAYRDRRYESTDSSSVTDSTSSERANRKRRSKKSASTEPRTPKMVSTGTTPTVVTIPTMTPASRRSAPIEDLSPQVDFWQQRTQALMQQQQQPPPTGYYQQGFGQVSASEGLLPLAQVRLAPNNQIQLEPVIESTCDGPKAETTYYSATRWH
uniref:RNA-directed DNA polymerase n=1 Tax=Strigamia maritima TaxID=126957 RepID=T1IMD7_STRMM